MGRVYTIARRKAKASVIPVEKKQAAAPGRTQAA
jgi:hypothetical protein